MTYPHLTDAHHLKHFISNNYEKDSNNLSELKKLEDRILFLEQDPDAKLESMSIFGISSPEGNYAKK